MVLSRNRSKWIVLAAIGLLPVLLVFVAGLETDTDNIRNWLPENTPQSLKYREFVELYGHDDELLISWPGCTVDDPRLEEFVFRLNENNRINGLFSSIVSGKTVLDQLAGKKFSYPQRKLRRRLSGYLFDANSDTTAIIVSLSAFGSSRGQDCIDEIFRQAKSTTGLACDELKITGNAYTTVQIDTATSSSLFFSLPAILLAGLVTYCCLRDVRFTLFSLSTAGFAALQSVALVAICGCKFNGLLVMMPLLVLVLTLSATVHLCSYYKRAIGQNAIDPVKEMMLKGNRPCLLAILTTAVGIATLGISNIPAVRQFGYFSSVGLVASLSCIVVLFPALLRLWPDSPNPPREPNSSFVFRVYESYSPGRVAFFSLATVIGCILSIPLLVIGVGRIESKLRPEKMFSKQHSVTQNHRWLDKKFAGLKSIDVSIAFDGKIAEEDLVDQLYQVRSIQSGISRMPCIQSTFSIINCCRLPSTTTSASNFVQKALVNNALADEFSSFIDRRQVAVRDNTISWRVRIQVDPTREAELASLMKQIEQRCDSISTGLPSQPATSVTGLWPLAASGRHQIFDDLVKSFALAFLIITPIIMILVRGVVTGLLVMVPNVFPALAFFGTLGWLGISIDIGTVLTACVGLGIAVDDTLHFLFEYKRNRQSGCADRFANVLSTIGICFRPMVYTTLICSTGLSVFVFSDFLPSQNFAVAISALLVLALICDLVLLPALILSPLGRFF